MIAPEPGQVQRPAAGLRMVLAPNPSPMTLHGTNSYILGHGAVALIDPGPDLPEHLAALEAALAPGERIAQIFVTHAHRDHSPLADVLGARWGAPVLAFGAADAGRSPAMEALARAGEIGGGEGVDADFRPDRCLADGETVAAETWQLRARWTPGHMGNHMCFQWGDLVFTGDHVMGWASSLVSPPDGDMGAYMRSLEKLARLGARRMFSAHGDPIDAPAARIAELAAHRRSREAQILAALGPEPRGIGEIAAGIYRDVSPKLLRAARRNVLAHLLDLTARGLAQPLGPPGPDTRFRTPPA
ncbi:MBL fold metallo-hydrolase [Alkalilacustris brevis]|uniref:MBL fold metallo-hydrolase n=1 Tax=Alkalilacustris brevis TaxID=2026338 RepID=UPI000E0DD648|nr:MBL fold metallo-hydrolase [Alkalilacustris brevis]